MEEKCKALRVTAGGTYNYHWNLNGMHRNRYELAYGSVRVMTGLETGGWVVNSIRSSGCSS
jgi:hypothetical protein